MKSIIVSRIRSLLALVALTSLLFACGPDFRQPTPTNFVKLDNQHRYSYRAVTADGLVYAVKQLEHSPKGDLEFWSKAIENKLRLQTGYALLGKDEITTNSGLKGIQLRFGFDRSKQPHLYNVTVITTGDYIFLIESGGTLELVEEHSKELKDAVKSFSLN